MIDLNFLKPEVRPILLNLINKGIYSSEDVEEIKDLKRPNEHVVTMGYNYLPDSIQVALYKGKDLSKEQKQVLIDYGLADSLGNLITLMRERVNLFKNLRG